MEEVRQGNDKYKIPFFILLFLVVIAAIVGGFYFLGKQQQVGPGLTPTAVPTTIEAVPTGESSISPTQTTLQVKDEAVVPVGQSTVSFARVGEDTYLRYRGKIYDDTNQAEPHELDLQNPEQYSWYGLVDAPFGVKPNEFMEDEVFSFKVAPDKKSFAFTMRWGTSVQYSEYYLFYYTPFDKFRQSILVKKFPTNDPAKIDQFSSDSKYLFINLFDCWNCGGHKPETMLVRLTDNEMKNIGKVSYFNWLADGKYEYKDYVVITCTQETMGECSEEPEKLPLKSGQF
jgi:hypothetical protein